MPTLIGKLNYKNQERIAVINVTDGIMDVLSSELKGVTIDKVIDPRYAYSFIVLFVKNINEIEHHTPMAIHNLQDDGVLWFCYPKKTSKKLKTDITRDNGWKTLNDSGLFGIRMVAMDEDWSAMRFRNIKYIKSNSDRYKR